MTDTTTEAALQISVAFDPIPFRQAGKWTLVYETLLENRTEQRWQVQQIKISDPASGRLISAWGKTEIGENSRFLQSTYRPAEAEALEAGLVHTAFHWLTFDARTDVPNVLHHNFHLVDENGTGREVERDVYIQHTQPVVIRPPLVGRGWLAAEGASNFTGHRRTPIPIDAQPYFAQRYAVDWIQYGENGLPVHGPAERNESWFCYGAEVLAVADGVITMTQDGIIENVALEKPAIEITLQSAPGNLIIQEIGDGHFAFYAHLIPGSLTVKEGVRVRAGQVIARLGNSGNSDAPHLHFHIGSRNSPLGAQGLPYHFAAFQRAGYAGSTDEVMRRLTAGEAWQSDQAPEWRENEMFASNDVINLE